MSCDGDRIRTCVPDPYSTSGVATKWQVIQTCADDPVLGPLTCGADMGAPRCVRQAADGTQATDDTIVGEERAVWLQVGVLMSDGSASLDAVEIHTLDGMPASAAAGPYAVVAYADTSIVDAALVPAMAEGSTAVFVKGEDVSRVELIDPKGGVVARKDVDGVSTKRGSLTSASRRALIGYQLPPTLRQVFPVDRELPLAKEAQDHLLRLIEPTNEMLELVGEPLLRHRLGAITAITSVAFVAGPVPKESPAGQSADTGRNPVAAARLQRGDETFSAIRRTRTYLSGTVLVVDMSEDFLAEYRASQEARLALALEMSRRVGQSYAAIAAVATSEPASGHAEAKNVPVPIDYPPKVAQALRKRVAPMLAVNEAFATAWRTLHGLGVESGFSIPYFSPDEPKTALPLAAMFPAPLARDYTGDYPLPSNAEAVEMGFASSLGAAMPSLDFAEFLAYATVQEAWSFGPCGEIRATPLDKLRLNMVMPLSKLYVLWGLGLIGYDDLKACVGTLGVETDVPGFVVRRVNGESLHFDEEIGGARTAFLYSETHASGFAALGDLHTSFDLMWRGVMPGVARLAPVQNARAQNTGATLVFTDDAAAVTAPSAGGLLVMTEVSPKRLEGRALMVVTSSPIFGERIFPLVSFRIDKPDWPETGADE
jgi:hypothetical protein